MAEGQRMTTADVVAKVMAGEHGDFVRELIHRCLNTIRAGLLRPCTGERGD